MPQMQPYKEKKRKKRKKGFESKGTLVPVVGKLVNFLAFFFFFVLFRTTPVANGSSQARGQIRAVAASLHHSHSNAGSEPHLQPIRQLTAMSDP